MSKEKLKQNVKPVGADDPVCPNSRGITLIALIITIIVMLILVGVSVTVALNGGLFSSAQDATAKTETERDKELTLDEGKVEVGETVYDSFDEYVKGSSEESKVAITPKKENYIVGEEVTIGDEHFFVIADDNEKVTLLAKYNLNKEGTTQLNATSLETGCAFSQTPYWTEEDADLNDNANPDGAMAKAKSYGTAIGGTGRLMRKDEAEILVENHEGIIYGTTINHTDGYLTYWLASAAGSYQVWNVGGYSGSCWYKGHYSMDNAYFGVRPVVEISKSAI